MNDRGLDHLVYATPHLDRSVGELEALLGVRAAYGGAHPGWGTRNALLGLGPGAYLEVIGPDPDQPDPLRSRPFLIDDLSEGRLVTWAYRHPELEGTRSELSRLGFHLGPVHAMSRERPDGRVLAWRLTLPETLPGGGVVPFLIDWGATPHPSTSAVAGCTLIELRAGHPEPEAVALALEGLGAQMAVVLATRPQLVAVLDTPRGRVELR